MIRKSKRNGRCSVDGECAANASLSRTYYSGRPAIPLCRCSGMPYFNLQVEGYE